MYELPTRQSSLRVNLWRKLKKTGAIALKSSAYLLPDTPAHHERFQWLRQQVRDAGGDATLIHVTEIEGLSEPAIVQLFNDARGKEYAELQGPLSDLVKRNRKRLKDDFAEVLEKLRARFEEIHSVDFFDSSDGIELRKLIDAATRLQQGDMDASVLDPRDYRRRIWLTRPRPQIDRVASAWLIRRWIDPKARFLFAADCRTNPTAIPFDLADVEFGHHGEDCTFETLVKRFAIVDPAVQKIAEAVHDADLEDGKFQRPEGFGLHRALQGWATLGVSDSELVGKGSDALDALYAAWRKPE